MFLISLVIPLLKSYGVFDKHVMPLLENYGDFDKPCDTIIEEPRCFG